MSLIVDASVATKWFFREAQWQEAQAVSTFGELIAPDLILAEIGNAVWKRRLKGELSTTLALDIITETFAAFDRLIVMKELAADAMRISSTLLHPIYDCFYLALAERERLPIITADGKLLAAAQRLGTVEARRL